MRALFGIAAPAGSAERAHLEPGIETRVVRHADLFPTLLDVLNLSYDVSEFDGASLLDVAGPEHGAYGETYFPLFHYGWSPLLTWRDDRWSYVEGVYAELFDIVADPAEEHDVLDAHPDVARTLAARLHAIARDPSDEPVKPMDTETREKLEALGYVGSGSTPTVDRARDPRDLIEVANDLFRGIDLIGKGDARGAAPYLERAVAADPNNVTALFHLADCYRQVGRPRAAMEHYRRAIECDPRAPVAYGHLALLEYETGDTDEAFAVLDAGLSVDPDAFPLLMTSADIHAAEGHVERARRSYERALELESDRVEPYVGLAALAEKLGDRDEAARRWAQAIAINPNDPHIPASVRDASVSR
jgi:Flp pilus assembly protein TadD